MAQRTVTISEAAKLTGLTKAAILSRPQTMWRYRELLPTAQEPTVGRQVGFTPLVKADRLGAERLRMARPEDATRFSNRVRRRAKTSWKG